MLKALSIRSAIYVIGRGALASALAVAFAFTTFFLPSLHAQTFNVLHNFSNGADGGFPLSGLTVDGTGNLYGTTNGGGTGHGTVFQLKRNRSHFTFAVLYTFTGNQDGAGPAARVIFGPDHSLYGTTQTGGTGNGVVYNLQLPANPCVSPICPPWPEKTIYSFAGHNDGAEPGTGDLLFDRNGNIYGTTIIGGTSGVGTAFKLHSTQNNWSESVIADFGGSAGSNPYSGMVQDSAGNLYGTTTQVGSGFGTIYKLAPSGSSWIETTIYNFTGGNDGGYPYGGLILDSSGNLYGTTSKFGRSGGGTVFKLTPSQGSWSIDALYSFSGNGGPNGSLTMDSAGNLYGITGQNNGHVYGEVFKLAPSGNSWTYTVLYDFTGGNDGAYPQGNVVLDRSGNLYGTAELGGTLGLGTVWEITP